jgi:hypothetical protein
MTTATTALLALCYYNKQWTRFGDERSATRARRVLRVAGRRMDVVVGGASGGGGGRRCDTRRKGYESSG